MATNKVNVIAIVSFEGVRVGDVAAVDMTPRLKGLIASGYLKVVGELEGYDGTFPTGPDADEESGAGGSYGGGAYGVSDSGEPGEGARPRRHRKATVVGQEHGKQ